MRSLATKLTLAFLFVGIIGAILVGVIIHRRTNLAFDRFLLNRAGTVVARQLGEFYDIHNGWLGVESLFRSPTSPGEMLPGESGQYPANFQAISFILVGADGRIIFGDRNAVGRQVPDRELRKAAKILSDGDVVGYLLPRSSPTIFGGSSPEEIFLGNVNLAILLGVIAAAAIALVLGGFLAYSMTGQLRELTTATGRIAGGDLGYQVEVRSQDELGELAASFNQMSADLKRSNQARKQMTADIAHDLRSPLSVILGYAEALTDGKLSGNPEIFDVMYREAGQLNHLIDDLRTLSLADAGELSLNLRQIAPQELLEDTRRAYQFQAQDKKISLRVEAQTSTPRILVDPNRMTQVLGNLVGNALRFTPPGGEIVLGAESISGAVQISVRDNGTGIDATDLPNIFDRFYRSDQSRSHNGETGLGLAIARSLVEAQGGQITATSKPGETIFLVKFPLHDSP